MASHKRNRLCHQLCKDCQRPPLPSPCQRLHLVIRPSQRISTRAWKGNIDRKKAYCWKVSSERITVKGSNLLPCHNCISHIARVIPFFIHPRAPSDHALYTPITPFSLCALSATPHFPILPINPATLSPSFATSSSTYISAYLCTIDL